jgi:hypothetical protein
MTENIGPYGEILEAADKLPIVDQELLIDVLKKRVIERRREALSHDIKEARKEFDSGMCKPKTPNEIMDEILT